MFIWECVVVVVLVDNRWEMVEDVVDVVVFVEYSCLMLWVDIPVINLPNVEYGLVISISSWRLRFRSGSRNSMSNFPPLN